jgi:hypothetical protein
MPYLGNTPTTQSFISGTDYFNGTGSQTAFTLSRTVASVNDIQAVVNNVVQVPNDAYTLSGTTITFTSAPSAGTQNVYVRYLSTTTQAITPSQGTVSWSTLNSDVQQDLGISYKNRIINGAMTIAQRGTGLFTNNVSSGDLFAVDRFNSFVSGSSGVFTAQQSSDVPTGSGFKNSVVLTVTTADSSLTTGDLCAFRQIIEGFNCLDLMWGTANAKTVTVSFWAKSSITGTHSGTLTNGDWTRAYAFTYTISAANTWQYITITAPGAPSGSWGSSNDRGIQVVFNVGAASANLSTANTWSTTSAVTVGATGSVQLISTNGATFYITGVQLEVGTQATTFTTAGGSYGAELALCQRYYTINLLAGANIGGYYSTNSGVAFYKTPVTMRASPTVSLQSNTTVSVDVAGVGSAVVTPTSYDNISVNGFRMVITTGLSSASIGQPFSVTTNVVQASSEL